MKRIKLTKNSIMSLYRRSFSRGVGSIISIPGNYFPMPDLSQNNDTEALRSDWAAVGNYIRYAIRKNK
ncbi:MAG: hypothetical protein HDS13_06040 [Bacteroides sp.]|nr:hypothetical protein [Bacteroides sp.]